MGVKDGLCKGAAHGRFGVMEIFCVLIVVGLCESMHVFELTGYLP